MLTGRPLPLAPHILGFDYIPSSWPHNYISTVKTVLMGHRGKQRTNTSAMIISTQSDVWCPTMLGINTRT